MDIRYLHYYFFVYIIAFDNNEKKINIRELKISASAFF